MFLIHEHFAAIEQQVVPSALFAKSTRNATYIAFLHDIAELSANRHDVHIFNPHLITVYAQQHVMVIKRIIGVHAKNGMPAVVYAVDFGKVIAKILAAIYAAQKQAGQTQVADQVGLVVHFIFFLTGKFKLFIPIAIIHNAVYKGTLIKVHIQHTNLTVGKIRFNAVSKSFYTWPQIFRIGLLF